MTTPLSPVDLSALKNKSVLITGGSSGLGLETVHLFLSAGAYVTIADVQPPLDDGVLGPGPPQQQQQHDAAAQWQYVHCDVSDWTSQVEAFKRAIKFGPPGAGGIDIVATFAAVDFAQHLVDFTMAAAAGSASLDRDPVAPTTKCLDVNLRGTFFSAALALHYFRLFSPPPSASASSASSTTTTTTTTKSLIFISSLAAYLDDTHNTTYTTSKFGTRGLFRALRARAHDEMNVRVNLIAPWGVKTPMTAPLLEMLEKAGIQEGQGFTFAAKEDVARAAARCAVDEELYGTSLSLLTQLSSFSPLFCSQCAPDGAFADHRRWTAVTMPRPRNCSRA